MSESHKEFTKSLSFEFFPPRTEDGIKKLSNVAKIFSKFNPTFFSVTYGAGGSNQEKTLETVFNLTDLNKVPIAPHISCIGSSKKNIRDLLTTYENHKIHRLVAIRGDFPPVNYEQGNFEHAAELVAFIRETSGDYFHVEVAAYPEYHPESASPNSEIKFFKQKVLAGANSAITQYFFNVDAYVKFIDDCNDEEINIPIVPGIMPIHNCQQLERFSDTCGAELPRWIRKKLEEYQNDEESLKAFGIDIVSELCMKLLNLQAPGLHFYTLNQSEVTVKICENLKISLPGT